MSHSEHELPEPKRDYKEELEEVAEEFARHTDDPGKAAARRLAIEISGEVGALEMRTFNDPVVENIQDGQVVQNADEAVVGSDAVIKDLREQLAKLSVKFAEQETSRKSYNLSRFLAVFSVVSALGAIATLIYNGLRNAKLDKPIPPEIPADVASRIRDLVKQWSDDTDPYYWHSMADYVELSERQGTPLTLADQVLFMDYTIGLFPCDQMFLWDSGADIKAFVDQLVAAYGEAGDSTPAMYRLVPELRYHGEPLPRGVAAGLLRYALTHILVLLPAAGLGGPGEGEEGDLSKPKDEESQREESREEVEERREHDDYAAQNAHTADAVNSVVSTLSVRSANTQAVDAARDSVPAVTSSGIRDPRPDARYGELTDKAATAADRTAAAPEDAKNNNTRRYLSGFILLVAVGSTAAVIMEYLIRQARKQPTDDLPPIPDATKQQIQQLVQAWNAQPDATYWASLADYADAHDDLTAADQILFCNYTIQLSQASGFFLWDSAADKTKVVDRLVAAYAKGGNRTSAMYRAAAGLTYHDKPLPRADTADVLRLALAWIFRTAFAPDQPREPAVESAAHLLPRIRVAAVADGHNPDVYLRGLLGHLYPDLPPHAATAVRHLTVTRREPYELLDADEAVRALPPAARARLGDRYALLRAKLQRTFPVPDGERLERSTLTALAEPHGSLPAGTVVWVRATDAATVHFALPHIVVDAATGQPRLTGLPARPALPPRTELPDVQVGGAADAALQVAGCLVWGLPEPWGPIAAAGVTLVSMLFGPDNPDPFQAVVTRIEDFIKQQDITRQATVIRGFADWMVQQQGVLESTQGDNTEYILQSLLPELRKMTAPGDESVYNAIYDLENYLTVPGAFDLLVLGVSVHLLGLKMIVQLDALVASAAHKRDDNATYESYNQLWRSDYANFHAAVLGDSAQPGWARRIGKHIADFESSRLGQITEPYRYDDREVMTDGTGVFIYDNWGWTYRDSALGEDDMRHFVADTFVTSGCCDSDSTRVEHRTEVQTARDQHVQDVVKQLDQQYGGHVQTAKKWQDAIDQWNEHLPPQRPAQAPTISSTGWAYTTPHGAWWVDGNKVSYSVVFVNSSGPSPAGPYTPRVTIQGKAGATLTGLPDDPLGMATARQVICRIDTPANDSQTAVVGGTTSMSAHTYQDVNPLS
ncbi:hypothetical protein [Nonomuraea sp. NPDC050783]|uniref:hypothetical protein n=1 Tax=Nonomuraea sp. NPDC050783 TaxID=3154634 RepID=UPI0034658448